MAARPVRPAARATLAAPRRFVLAGATGGLVTLASIGTAVLILTGTSAVSPPAAQVPPLPAPAPVAGDPGVVVLPTPVTVRSAIRTHRGQLGTAPASGPVAVRPLPLAPAVPPVPPPPVPTVPVGPVVPVVAVVPQPALPPVPPAAPTAAPSAGPLRAALQGTGAVAVDEVGRLHHRLTGKHAKHPKHPKHPKHGRGHQQS